MRIYAVDLLRQQEQPGPRVHEFSGLVQIRPEKHQTHLAILKLFEYTVFIGLVESAQYAGLPICLDAVIHELDTLQNCFYGETT